MAFKHGYGWSSSYEPDSLISSAMSVTFLLFIQAAGPASWTGLGGQDLASFVGRLGHEFGMDNAGRAVSLIQSLKTWSL